MKRSNDRITNMVLNYIGEETLNNIDSFSDNLKNQPHINFSKYEELNNFFGNGVYDNISNQEIDSIRYYTGISYREINAVLRDNWTYETNGLLTEEKKHEYLELANEIGNSIEKVAPLPGNIATYRGVDLSSFKRYGVNTLEDLLNLKGEYFYEQAFTSTSLIRSASFFDRDLEWHSRCNIEIKYIIPAYSTEGVPLLDTNTSYSSNQSEYLINKSSLSKIVDVQLSEDRTKAYVTMALIPQKVWDKQKQENDNQTREI